ncbi:MAG: hypothetical protein LBJ00_13020 [Planctomycetaceae bacterium]|nr:hypothetical protein [Planctomycetaceae bacterium]
MKFPKRNTQAQQREAVAQGRSLSPYRLRYTHADFCTMRFILIPQRNQNDRL